MFEITENDPKSVNVVRLCEPVQIFDLVLVCAGSIPFGIAFLAYKRVGWGGGGGVGPEGAQGARRAPWPKGPEGPFGPFGPLDLLALGPPWARPALLGIGRARSEKTRNVFIRSNLIRVGGCRGA